MVADEERDVIEVLERDRREVEEMLPELESLPRMAVVQRRRCLTVGGLATGRGSAD